MAYASDNIFHNPHSSSSYRGRDNIYNHSSMASFTMWLMLCLITCASCVNGEVPQFTYLGPSGPQKWGTLSPTYSACSHGKIQSPVNIVKSKCVSGSGRHLKPLDIEYHVAVNATLVDNLFNVAMQYDGNAGVLRLNGKNYSLIQMHWHSPSEHQLEGVQYDAELHLVHKSSDGETSVVAVLYRYGHPDPLLSKIQSKLAQLMKVVHTSSHEHAQIAIGTITTKEIRKHSRKYYRYVGSFSTPPCTEGVIWNILGKVRSISREQVEALKAPLMFECKRNSRPVQPLNGRKIELYDDKMSH